MTTFLLFGAGASRFSGDCSPIPPPLGPDFFDELVKRGGIAATVEADIAEVFRGNFEVGTSMFRQRRGAEVTTLLIEMADYFARFTPGLSNLYVKLLAGMSDTNRRFAIATLNYELLIELSATHIGRTISYTVSGAGRHSIPILKPHGSCNFLPDLAPRQIYNLSVNIVDTTKHAAIVDAPVRAANVTEVLEFCARENSIAPALALYEKGKDTLFCPTFVRQQQAEYKDTVAQASRIFVIGARVNEEDEHIWLPLAQARAPLYYVGPDTRELLPWAAKYRRRSVSHFARSFEDAVPKIISIQKR